MAAILNMLALDVGERRVGTALANSVAKLSSPLKTLNQSDQIYSDIKKIVEEKLINLLIIGLPRSLNGEDSSQTKYVREFSTNLQKLINITILFEDETLSTVRAKKILNESKKVYSKEDIDSLAACLILDDFIVNNPEVVNAQKS